MNSSNGYVDLHTHLLPGIDDGSSSMEETIRMLRIAQEQEIHTIIATPHYAAGAKNVSVEQLTFVRDQVQEQAQKLNEKMKLLLGNEIYYSGSVLEDLKSKKALTLAGSRYVLIEFSPRESGSAIYKGLCELSRAGYAPVLAHVERYQCFHKKEHLISDIINMGCYIQMNSSSLIGGLFDSEAAYHRKLFNRGLIHFVGSDCHDSKERIPSMKTTVNTLRKKCDERLVDAVFDKNPFNVLTNTYI